MSLASRVQPSSLSTWKTSQGRAPESSLPVACLGNTELLCVLCPPCMPHTSAPSLMLSFPRCSSSFHIFKFDVIFQGQAKCLSCMKPFQADIIAPSLEPPEHITQTPLLVPITGGLIASDISSPLSALWRQTMSSPFIYK